MSVTIGQVSAAVAKAFPLEWAEPWDNVGLLAGDTSTVVEGVLVTLDATPDSIRDAVARGANLLATHHPPTLIASMRVTPAATPLYQAVAGGVAIISAHTNLDRAPDGAAALPLALGLPAGDPLERGSGETDLVTVYCPSEHRGEVASAMATAGAGRLGLYEACSFTSEGTGRFTPGASADPAIGAPGVHSSAVESRIEMVCPRGLADAVMAAARAAHPYEEPLILVQSARISRGAARLGRISAVAEPTTLASLAAKVAKRLECTPRVWGDPDRRVARVATASGSGRSLIDDAIAAGADALVTGEVRYHDALMALEAGLAMVEAGHDTTEWPLVTVLGSAIRAIPDLAAEVYVESRGPGWWTP